MAVQQKQYPQERHLDIVFAVFVVAMVVTLANERRAKNDSNASLCQYDVYERHSAILELPYSIQVLEMAYWTDAQVQVAAQLIDRE